MWFRDDEIENWQVNLPRISLAGDSVQVAKIWNMESGQHLMDLFEYFVFAYAAFCFFLFVAKIHE